MNRVLPPTASTLYREQHGPSRDGSIAARYNGIGPAGVSRGCSPMVARIYNGERIPDSAPAAALSELGAVSGK